MQIDTTTEFGGRTVRRLNQELIGWLTTVDASGTPQPSPIWFVWDGETALIYSQPNTPKLRHIAANPKVSVACINSSRSTLVTQFCPAFFPAYPCFLSITASITSQDSWNISSRTRQPLRLPNSTLVPTTCAGHTRATLLRFPSSPSR